MHDSFCRYNSMVVGAVAQGPLCRALARAAQTCTAQNFDLATTGTRFLGCNVVELKSLLDDESVHAASEDSVLDAVLRCVSGRRG